MFERLAGVVALQWGWRRYLLALMAGALAAFAQAPYHLFPILWLSLPTLIWLVDGVVDTSGGRRQTLMTAFRIGWTFGFGYFLNGLWWVGDAFLVDADQYAWAMPFAVVLLPAGLALFSAIAVMAARLFWVTGPQRVGIFAIAWTIAEYGRGHLLTGFPWNDLGYGLAANDAMMQAAALVGLPGLTLPAALIFAAPAVLDGSRGGWRWAGAAACLYLAILGYGLVRLHGATSAAVPNMRLRLIQPAITEWSKWRKDAQAEVLAGYIDLSSMGPEGLRTGLSGINVLIWPESPFSFLLAREQWALSSIAEMLRKGSTTLITGAIRAEPADSESDRPRFYNSAYVLDGNGEIRAAYDKAHLVPFGEYLPYQPFFHAIGLQQLTQIKSAFQAGPGPKTLVVPGAPPVGIMICYEAVFPGSIVEAGNRPEWLVNLTNDSWFGLTPGPYQHLYQARMRAVEEGLPVVRDANSGISAVIDSYGRVLKSLGLGKAGVVDADLPVAIDPPFYTTIRDRSLLVELFVTLLFIICANFWTKR